jgi:hypothetical protein
VKNGRVNGLLDIINASCLGKNFAGPIRNLSRRQCCGSGPLKIFYLFFVEHRGDASIPPWRALQYMKFFFISFILWAVSTSFDPDSIES